MDPVLTLTDEPDPGLRDRTNAVFHAHAAAHGIANDFRSLSIQVERDGALVGGMLGRTGRGWLYVEHLALPPSERGAGLGRRILAMAEAEAARRGCVGVYLFTEQHQAPGFYETLGYREFGRLRHDDPRLDRIWFSKRLDA